MTGLCSFNDIWLEREKYKEWLQKDKLCKQKAFCTLCKKIINLASMGEGALTSHAKVDRMSPFLIGKEAEKSPLKYPLVKNMSWADPRLMQSESDKEKGETKLHRVLRIMCEAGREVESRCDLILTQYRKLVDEVIQLDNHPLKCFNSSDDSPDEVFYSVLSKRKEYVELWNVLQKMLLSHGQATVERGFSVNKQVSVENLSRESLRAQRLITDTMRKAGGPLEIIISNEMMTYASSARHEYHAYLDKKKAEEKDEKKNQKRKETGVSLG